MGILAEIPFVMQGFINLINRYSPISAATEDAILRVMQYERYKKNDLLLREGQVCRKVWYIQSGLVRRFFRQDEKEITQWLYWEDDLITSLHSFSNQLPAAESIQACVDTEVYSITYAQSQALFKIHPDLERFSQQHLQNRLSCLDKFTREFYHLDATQKYDYLLQLAPEILRRGKLAHIASIMGVTQETVSRIRASARHPYKI